MKNRDFGTAFTEMRNQYGLELDSYDFESVGITAWNKINNKGYYLYKVQLIPIKAENGYKEGYYVLIPNNCDKIVSLTKGTEDYNYVSNITNFPDPLSIWTENYIEFRKNNKDPLYAGGGFIKYEIFGDKIFFNSKYNYINLFYKGYIVDDDGLPKLSDKEVDAIAAFCAYTHSLRKYYETLDQNVLNRTKIMEERWNKLCSQARVPEYVSENDMDKILNAKVSADRKTYNKSYKAIK